MYLPEVGFDLECLPWWGQVISVVLGIAAFFGGLFVGIR